MSSNRTPLIYILAAVAGMLVVALSGWIFERSLMNPAYLIPERFARDLPPACRQIMLVASPEKSSITAKLWLMERQDADGSWKVRQAPIDVTLGRNGLAWGIGEHTGAPPAGFPLKHEGDGCSPAGIFRIPFAFGLASQEEAAHLRLPYTFLTSDIFGVEDPNSRYYNQVVDVTKVQRDWGDEEHLPMKRYASLYHWGAFVEHNPERIPGAGSCIFLHRWPAPGAPTAGCTGMTEKDLGNVLAWLDPALEPRLIQCVEGW
jgi:L,D-peptidoglycan transpeptidase YkuD (ErfK/YbiS/YcfS/YnhG family)